MKYGNATLGQIEAVWNKLGGEEGVKRFLSGELVLQPKAISLEIFRVIIYDLSVEELIEAGKYEWKDPDINSRKFPSNHRTEEATIKIELWHFSKAISSKNAIKAIAEKGRRPANLKELLSLGAKFPDEQKKSPIVALGSVVRDFGDRQRVACLRRDGNARTLTLNSIGGEWYDFCRFAAVCE